MSRSNPEYEIISDLGELMAIGPHWDRLADNFPTPLLSHAWFTSAAAALHPDDQIHVVLKKSAGEVCGVAPMVKRRRHGFRSLEVIGSDILREPAGLLYKTPGDLRDILDHLAGYRLPLYFDTLADPVLVAELSVIRGVASAPGSREGVSGSPWVRIDRSWQEYYEGLDSSWRSARRRAHKKADAAGKVDFEFISPDPDCLDRLMEEFILVEGRGWKGRLGTALANTIRGRGFFKLYGREAAGKGILRLAFMRIDGAPVAAHFAVECHRRYWLLKIGYDEKWSPCSPGILLMYAALERAFDLRLEAFEFLGRNEPWIRIWKHKLHTYHQRSVDQVPARRMATRAIATCGKIHQRIRTKLARRSTGG
ncbi:MAG TPA: GNAT family N-acetyltransferase [Bacteroidota bacterium]|nr:GNAT family N-acetyltransferase [Bacteroidota bacterium]